MADTSLIELVSVHKTYPNGAVALEDVHFTLANGEFVSLLGPSGCGKSTVLRLIAGLAQPTAGLLRRNWEEDASRRPLACVFQEPTLLPWTTVRQNVFLPLRLEGISSAAARSRVDEALERVGLHGFAQAYPCELSGGMKMRASIARALVTAPRLLLMDEPFAALDELTRMRLNDDLLSLWRQARWTGLFITHSVFESVYLSNRVLVMSPRPGRVAKEVVIDLPHKRQPEVRTSLRYLELCREVSEALARAAAPDMADSRST